MWIKIFGQVVKWEKNHIYVFVESDNFDWSYPLFWWKARTLKEINLRDQVFKLFSLYNGWVTREESVFKNKLFGNLVELKTP